LCGILGAYIAKEAAIINFIKKHSMLTAYILWGIITTLVNLVTYFICTNLFRWDYLLSNLTAWILAVLFAFFVNKVLVFHAGNWHKGAVFSELWKFVGARVFSFLCESFLLWLGVSVVGMPDGIIKILVGIIVIAMNYIFSKLFIFRGKESCIWQIFTVL